MPSVTYMNQSAPFWDFVASLEQQGSDHPWFGQNNNRDGPEDNSEEHPNHPPPPPPFAPWGWGHGFGGRGFPSRGPPPHHEQHEGEKEKDDNEKEGEKEKENDNGEGPSGSGSETEGGGRRRCGRRGGRCGEGRRGRHGWGGPYHGGPGHHGPGPRGPPPFGPHAHHGPGPHRHHGPPHHERGHGRGGFGGPWGGRGGFNPWTFAANWLNPDNYNNTGDTASSDDFSPEADIFDTPTTYVVHISLPGAKKEDVGVNWDAEKSELSVAGVVYRPGEEEFLKMLAMDERKVGPFERKIWLGTRANPAQIDAEGITAKLEDGILRVEVPKRLDEGFVEVRKVDIE